MTELFYIQALPEGTSIYYISPGETKPFLPNEHQNVVSAIKIRMNINFLVANNVVTVEYILEIHNVDNALTN